MISGSISSPSVRPNSAADGVGQHVDVEGLLRYARGVGEVEVLRPRFSCFQNS